MNNTALESLKNNLHTHTHDDHDNHDHHSRNKSLVIDKCGGLEQNSTAVKLVNKLLYLFLNY